MQETRSFQTSQSQGVGRTHPAPIEPLFVKRCWEPCNLTGIKRKCACLESLSSVNFTFQIFNVLFWHTFAPLFSRKSKSATIEQLFYCYLYWAQIYKCGKQHWDSKTDELWSQNGGNEHTELIQPVNTCLQYPFCIPTGRKKYMLYPLFLKHKICLFLHHSGGF